MAMDAHFTSPEEAALHDPFEGHGHAFERPPLVVMQHLESVIQAAAGRPGWQLQIVIPAAKIPGSPVWVAPVLLADPAAEGCHLTDLTEGECARIAAAIRDYVPDWDFGKSAGERRYDTLVAELRSGKTLDLAGVSFVLRWLTRSS
jgi:hypothetical protein